MVIKRGKGGEARGGGGEVGREGGFEGAKMTGGEGGWIGSETWECSRGENIERPCCVEDACLARSGFGGNSPEATAHACRPMV